MAAGALVTADGQIEWQGLLLGAGTPYRWRNLEGWLDLPDVRDADTDRPDTHGAFLGQLFAGRRLITYTWVTRGVDRASFPDAVNALRAATTIGDGSEHPLVVALHGRRHMVLARCIRRTLPTDRAYAIGYATGAIQWRATNPRILELPQLTATTRLPAPRTSGVAFPLVFPVSFGAATPPGGELLLTNRGNEAAQPVWRITGPVLGPAITNIDTGAVLGFDNDFEIPAGQSIELNHADRTVLVADFDVSRSHRLALRQWFDLPPGDTRVLFSAVQYSPSAELVCTYHHTSL